MALQPVLTLTSPPHSSHREEALCILPKTKTASTRHCQAPAIHPPHLSLSMVSIESPSSLKNIVLVHGALADGSSYQRIIPAL